MNSDNPENARISSIGGSSLLVAASAPASAGNAESALVPASIALLGDDACHAWVEFFASHIRNPNTRASYARAAHALFRWLGTGSSLNHLPWRSAGRSTWCASA